MTIFSLTQFIFVASIPKTSYSSPRMAYFDRKGKNVIWMPNSSTNNLIKMECQYFNYPMYRLVVVEEMWQKAAQYVPGHPWDLEKFPTFERCAQAAWDALGRAILMPVPKKFGQ